MAKLAHLMKFRAFCLATLAGWAAVMSGHAAPAGRPPNIIMILADDLGCGDISLYDGWVETPRIDRMAREGMKFTDFHSNSSVCSPTRAAYLTGRYQQRIGIVDVIVGKEDADVGLPDSATTIADVFRKNGYATALFGKWHCGFQNRHNPVNHGFDEFVGLLAGGADYHQHGNWRNGLKTEDIPGYSTDIITTKATDFIRRHKDRPFFLHVAHQAVHNPYQTRADTPETRDKEWKQNRVDDINRPRYRQIVEDLDAGVGAIFDALEETGLAGNTLLFFWSDNGDVQMSPRERPYRGGKFSQYEGGHRVPAVAWWPGHIKAGTTCGALLAGFDLFPTLTEIAGIPADNPKDLDGTSARSVLLDQQPLPQRDLFFGYEPKLGTAMRRGDWKMIVKEDDVQLYNLAHDLKETTNVAAQNPQITESMKQAIEEFKKTVVPSR